MKKNLTNAELMTILSKRDPNVPVDIYIDYCTFHCNYTYSGIDEDSGVCYSKKDDQLVICFGEIEC